MRLTGSDYRPCLEAVLMAREFGRVILPLTVLQRLDCVLEPTKAAVLARSQVLPIQSLRNVDPILECVAGQRFYDRSPLVFRTLMRRLKDDYLQDIGQK